MALLDQLPSGAHSAYALSKLRDAYSGSALRVRRSSDNAETDIGFDANGFLDTSTLQTFQGTAAFTYLVTWYDQSGNTNDITQTNAANQPFVASYSGGTFSMYFEHPVSGRQGVFFAGGQYIPASLFYTPSGFSSIVAYRPFDNTQGEQFLFNIASGGVEAVAHMQNRYATNDYLIRHDLGATDALDSTSSVATSGQYIITDFMNGTTTDAYVDGVAMTGTDFGRRNLGASYIGSRDTTGTYDLFGSIYGIIFYQSDEGSSSSSIYSETASFFANHQLFPSSVTTGTPVNGSPSATITANATANSITTAAVAIPSPTLSTTFSLSANSIVTATPSTGSPAAFTTIVLPVAPQTNIIVNGSKLHLFPDYKIGLSLNYSAGSIEGLEAGISDNFEVPFDDYNAGILGVNLASLSAGQRFDCTTEDEASNTIYEGYLEVISASVQTLYKSIELRFVDRVKRFVNTLKDTKLHELISAGEFDHDFQLAKPADTFSGVETLVSNSDFVRYVYTDYNGFDNLNVAALHRYNEDFAGGDGIQHLQPAFKVNEFINRIESFTGETITSQFFSNGISGIDTDKLYFQVPMRYHGFNTSLREDYMNLKFNSGHMFAGFPEQETPQSLNWINYKHKNRAGGKSQIMTDTANNFSVFMNNQTGTMSSTVPQSQSLVLRSGTYKFSGTISIPELNLSFIDPNIPTSGIVLQGINQFNGDVTLNLGVIINDASPKLIPLKTYNHTDFGTTGATSVTSGGVTYYNFLRAASDTVDYDSEDIELRMGDFVDIVLVLTGDGASFDIGRANVLAGGAPSLFQGFSVFDLSNTDGYNNLVFLFGTSTSSMPAPFSLTDIFSFSPLSSNTPLNHQATVSASKEYPLMGIPQWRLDAFFNLTFDYESVDFKENVKRFADISLYDILVDIMGRFNMGAWYNHSSGQFYFDNFAEQYIRTATAQNIKPNFDDDEVLDIDLQSPQVKSIALENEKGQGQDDTVLLEYTFGNLPQDILDEDQDIDLKYKSIFAIANGKNYGEPISLSDPMSPFEKFLRFYSPNENFQVSQYKMRIGFISDATKKITVGTPSPANFFIAQPSNVKDFVSYSARQNSVFALPTFQNIDQTNNLTIEFAVEDNGILNPEPATITTTYEKFWKWYVENMFGTAGFEGSFVFDKSEIKSLAPIEIYDFGYGDCVIESVDSFDLTEEKDKVRIKFRKI